MTEQLKLEYVDWILQFSSAAYRLTDGIVQRGPFKGMKLSTRFTWCGGEVLNLLFGIYEQEIAHLFYGLQGPYDHIINIGCAEGYYAVGLARNYPKARVSAYDIGSLECEITATNAKLNGVSDRVYVVKQAITPADLQHTIEGYRRTLIVSDCEGAEEQLLDPVKVPGLAHCDLIIESHSQPVTEGFPERFAATHTMETITEGQGMELAHLRNLLSRDWVIANTRGVNYVRDWLIGRVK